MSKKIVTLMIISFSLIGCSPKDIQPKIESDLGQIQQTVNTETSKEVPKPDEFNLVTYDTEPFTDGRYTVGKDLDAGEYVAYSTKGGVVNIYNSDSTLLVSSVIGAGLNMYFDLTEGQSVELINSSLGVSSSATLHQTDSGFVDGMYLIGKDIPEGSYLLTPVARNGVFEYFSSSSGSVSSLIASTVINKPTIIELKAGNYLNISGLTLKED
jgi:hypothetical protein